MAVTAPVLLLRYADVGVATYGSLRVVGRRDTTVTWVIDEPALAAARDLLTDALPDPRAGETIAESIERALTAGSFADPVAEAHLARLLGETLIPEAGWRLLGDEAATRGAVLFVAPTGRLAQMPWSTLAMPGGAHRLVEMIDVLFAVPPNIANAPRRPAMHRRDGASVLVLDPRVPGQRPDSALGSVLGRPDSATPVARHFAEVMQRRAVLPETGSAVELFRRSDADRGWLAALLDRRPSRLLFVGHATAADGTAGRADRAALHLAETHPLTAAELMAATLPMPARVALLACASGGDYRFDEATGLVAALILGGAVLVTATLWSLPTTAGYRRFVSDAGESVDPMADVVIGVDQAHDEPEAGRAVNAWQRGQLARWCAGDLTASPLFWAALATFATDGAR
jgi:hypothetical protein